jgi:hypothetical protein
MIYTLPLILKVMRQESNQNAVVRTMDASVEASYVDSAQDYLADRVLSVRPDMLSHYYDLAVTGLQQYYIPDSIQFSYETILRVEDVTGDDGTVARTGLSTVPTPWGDRLWYANGDVNPLKQPWSVRDQFLEFPDRPNGRTFRVWYTRRPVGLFYGTVGVGNTSTTVVFPTTPTAGERIPQDDYYNGMYGACASQVRRISDYVNSTKTATIESAWTTTPTDSVTEFSLISSLPNRLHPLIPDVAAKMIRGKVNDDEIGGIDALIEEVYTEYIGRLAHSQAQLGEQIRRVPRR